MNPSHTVPPAANEHVLVGSPREVPGQSSGEGREPLHEARSAPGDDLALDTDFDSLIDGLATAEPFRPQFTLATNRFQTRKALDRRQRRGIRKLIRPENAAEVVAHLPSGPNERTHAILCGNFVLCDLIPAILAARGIAGHLRVATLSLSLANAEQLAGLLARGQITRLTLIVSHYFQQVERAGVFAQVEALLGEIATIIVTRSHAKVICLRTLNGDSFVIEGSANLRSSDNLEQMFVVNDAETHDFHAAWIDELADRLAA